MNIDDYLAERDRRWAAYRRAQKRSAARWEGYKRTGDPTILHFFFRAYYAMDRAYLRATERMPLDVEAK